MLVLGANLTRDRVIQLAELVPGAVLRALAVDTAPGGKAVNVARVALSLGGRPVLVANLPGDSGAELADQLTALGLSVVPVRTRGVLRVATIVLDANGRTTVINEPGPPLDAADAAVLVEAYDRTLIVGEPRVVVLSGSLPPGAVDDLYADAVRTAHRHDAFAVVDVTGLPLAAALSAGADLVKPNLAEAEALLRGDGAPGRFVDAGGPDVGARCRAAAALLVDHGARAALVSGGRHGAALRAEGRSWWFAAPEVATVNAVGAGDTLVGGLAVALDRGDPLVEAVRFGMAAAAVGASRMEPGAVDVRSVRAMLDAVPDATDAEVRG